MGSKYTPSRKTPDRVLAYQMSFYNSTVKCVTRSVVWEYGPVNNSINKHLWWPTIRLCIKFSKIQTHRLVNSAFENLDQEFQQNISKVLSTKSVEAALFVVYGHYYKQIINKPSVPWQGNGRKWRNTRSASSLSLIFMGFLRRVWTD